MLMLSVTNKSIILNVIMLSVFMLNVMAPLISTKLGLIKKDDAVYEPIRVFERDLKINCHQQPSLLR
jgi:hypothetical protein